MNTQKQEGLFLDTQGFLKVFSIFDTIQGEGPFSGMPAVFVRLEGCNLQCPLCDTEYVSDVVPTHPNEVFKRVVAASPRSGSLIVLTGGEPLRQNVLPFVTTAIMAGHPVQIETNGTMPTEPVRDVLPYWTDRLTIVCSPKVPKVHPDCKPNCWKYVVRHGEVDPTDGLPTSVLGYQRPPARPKDMLRANIFVQPVDEMNEDRNKLNLQMAVNICMKYGYRLCLQTHKIIGLP